MVCYYYSCFGSTIWFSFSFDMENVCFEYLLVLESANEFLNNVVICGCGIVIVMELSYIRNSRVVFVNTEQHISIILRRYCINTCINIYYMCTIYVF